MLLGRMSLQVWIHGLLSLNRFWLFLKVLLVLLDWLLLFMVWLIGGEEFSWWGIRMLSLSLKHLLWVLGFPLAGCFRIRLSISFVRRGLVHAQDAFAFAKDPLCEEVLYPTISGTGKGACPFCFVRRSLKEKASFLFQTPSNKTVLRLCRRTPEIVVTRTGFKPVTF